MLPVVIGSLTLKQVVLSFEPVVTPGSSVLTALNGELFHYLIRVRRHRRGDRLNAITYNGSHFELLILKIEKNRCMVELTKQDCCNFQGEGTEPLITVIPAMMKGRKMDLAVRQSVEAGASAFWPMQTDRCQLNRQYTNNVPMKIERWKRIAIEALQQCGGASSIEIETPANLTEVLERWSHRGPAFFFHEKPLPSQMSLHHHLADDINELALFIGPEGGFSDDEVSCLETYDIRGIFLGDRILRAETAVLYGLAAIKTILRERKQWKLA